MNKGAVLKSAEGGKYTNCFRTDYVEKKGEQIMNNCDSPAVKKTKLMQNTELHHPAFPASKKINCAPKLCKECHPHSKKFCDSVIDAINKEVGVNENFKTSLNVISGKDQRGVKLNQEKRKYEVWNRDIRRWMLVTKEEYDETIEKLNKDRDIYKLTNKPALTKAMNLLEVSIEKYKAVKAKLKKTQNAWQASINENIELKHELDELKHLCSESILANLEYVLCRQSENNKKGE